MELLENKLLSLYADAAATLIAVSKDIQEYSYEYPEMSLDSRQNELLNQRVAPSGWGLPNQHYEQRIEHILEESRDLRYLQMIEQELEMRYVPKKTTEHFADVYNMLRGGELEKAIETLSSSQLQLHAAMLAGYQSMLGNNTVEIDVSEWLQQARSFSENSRYPLLERGVFGVLSGNNQPLRDWLSGRKTDFDDAWICCISGVREGFTGGNVKAYLEEAIQLISRLEPEHTKLVTANYLGYCDEVIKQFNTGNEQGNPAEISEQRRLALISTYILHTFGQVPNLSEIARPISAQINNIVEQYVRYILKIRNSPDNDLIPLLISNLNGQTSIQLLLLYLQTTNDLDESVRLAEECLACDEDNILEFKFTALQELSEQYFAEADVRIGKLYKIASGGRFPLPAAVQFVFILSVTRFLIENSHIELAHENLEVLGVLSERYPGELHASLEQEYLLNLHFMLAYRADFEKHFKAIPRSEENLLESFSESQRHLEQVIQIARNGTLLQDMNSPDIVAIEEIFGGAQTHHAKMVIEHLRFVVSRTVVSYLHEIFLFATAKETYKRRDLLNRIVEMPVMLISGSVRLADFLDKESATETLMVIEKAEIGILCK